ncbi:MAG TPA: rod shape-determining protein MreD [Gemmatimonadaceae bacterium]|jgi:rod shape-determining protein MreD|nr:rod shape-determining protein MreD [Gemmatimonadaceae bacterium]
MRPTDLLRTAFAFAVLVLLHFSLRPLLGWRASPDFLVIALLLVAIRVRPGTAALIGFLMGIIADSVTMHAFGASALSMSIVGFAASWLKAVFFADDIVLNAFFFFLGKWAFDVLYVLAEQNEGAGGVLMQLLVWSPLTAAVTAAAGIITLLVLRPVLRAAPT